MKKTAISALLFAFLVCASVEAQLYDNKGNMIWENWNKEFAPDPEAQRRNQNMADQFQRAMDEANIHRREMERIEAEQAVERQRAQQEQWARQQELEMQRQQAEQAAMRNWGVSVYGTTLWRENESAGMKDREERFIVTAPGAAQAEEKAVQLFKAKWKNYLVDNPNIWANAVAQ